MWKYKSYPAYKDSGVKWLGEVPEHWKIKKLKHLANVILSNVDKKTKEGESSVRLCNYTEVYYNELITESMDFMHASATSEQIIKFTLRQGDTLITKDSEDPNDIAVPANVPQNLPGVLCGYHLAVVRPKPGVEGAYVSRLFQSSYSNSTFATRANGLTRYGLSYGPLTSVEFPEPSTAEQSQIAAFLDHETAKIDRLIAKQEELIALLKEKRQAVISHAVTKGLDPDVPMKDSGVEWLGEIPAHWEVSQLRRVIASIEQGWSPEANNCPCDDDGHGVIKLSAIKKGKFYPNENKLLDSSLDLSKGLFLRENDLLITRANTPALVGDACIVGDVDQGKYMLCDLAYRVNTSHMILPQYLCSWIISTQGRVQIVMDARGSSMTMAKIAQEHIKSWLVPVPPHDEQTQIIDYISGKSSEVDAALESAVRFIELLQERRSALISAAVTGKIDVRDWKPNGAAQDDAA